MGFLYILVYNIINKRCLRHLIVIRLVCHVFMCCYDFVSVSIIFQLDFNCSDRVFTFYLLYFQTTFGEIIMIQNNGDVIGLSRFIITRLLGNPDIACEFSHPSVPHLYKDGNVIISPVLKSYNFVLDHIIYIKAYCKVLTFCFLSFSLLLKPIFKH